MTNQTNMMRELPNLDDHFCFGCSPINPSGLHMVFHADGESVVSRLTIPPHLCGWERLVHGGVTATMLDEIMGRSIIYQLGQFGLTRSITVDFLKPLLIEHEIEVRGHIVSSADRRHVIVEGSISDTAGTCFATSRGDFAVFPPKTLIKLGIISAESLSRMVELIEREQSCR